MAIEALAHGDLIGANVHRPFTFQFANAAARIAYASATTPDLGKFALQLDDGSFWRLTDIAPLWEPVGFQPVMTTQDDLIIGGAAGVATRLAKGTDGQVLTVDPTTHHLVWSTPSAGGSTLVDVKDSVRVATAAALPANTRTGDVLTATSNGALAAVDGVTLAAGERLLVKNEATGANNGIYEVTTVGSGGAPFVLTRTADANSDAEMSSGVFVYATEGTANGDKGWSLTTNDPITLNTTALVFTQLSAAATSPLTTKGDIHGFSTVDARIPIGSNGKILVADSTQTLGLQWIDDIKSFNPVIDGAGVVIVPGVKFYITLDFNGTWLTWTLLGDVGGAAVVNLWLDSYANYPPLVADKITASAPPTIVATNTKGQSSTLTGWTVNFTAGDVLAVVVDSCTTITKLTLGLKAKRR